MKLKLLFFSIVLNFAFIKEVSNNDELMLVGFENYKNISSNITFDILFKKYNNANESYSTACFGFILFIGTYYENKTDINCTKTTDVGDNLSYHCNFYSPVATEVQVKLNNTNFKFYFDNDNKIYTPKIIESSLAEKMKNEISAQTDSLNFLTFYFDYFTQINDDKVVINGTLESDINKSTYILNLSDKNYSCSVDNNSIIFNLSNSNINDNLIGKMLLNLTEGPKILIFSNNTSPNDLLMYSTVKSSSVDLYGFENYNKSRNGSAENVALFFGTSNILKKYLKFTAKIRYGSNSTLRFLDENTINITANGTIIPESTDVDNGVYKYKNVFPGTEGYSDMLAESYHDYQFSDDGLNFTPVKANIVGEYINLTNTYALEKPVFINFTEVNPTIDGNTFSFKFKLKSSNSTMNITKQQPVFLNYSSMETSERDEIDSCTIEKNTNTNIFTINCEPKKDIYTLLNSLIIKVPNITTNRRLRFLQSSGNSTIRVPKTTTGDIQFEYNPEVNTFGRKSSKKKGLSGGAIAAIVLATIAAVVAVGVAIFFLNRGPINPIKTSTEMNLPNSTTNINN